MSKFVSLSEIKNNTMKNLLLALMLMLGSTAMAAPEAQTFCF